MLARGLHAPNQVAAARRLAPLVRAADEVWVVAATADHGLAAARSGRPYACWVGTSLGDEWRGRRRGLSRSRRRMLSVSLLGLRRLEREVLQRSTRVFATSEASRAAIEPALDGRPIEILPIPVDTRRFTPASEAVWTAGIGPADDRLRGTRGRPPEEHRAPTRRLRPRAARTSHCAAPARRHAAPTTRAPAGRGSRERSRRSPRTFATRRSSPSRRGRKASASWWRKPFPAGSRS